MTTRKNLVFGLGLAIVSLLFLNFIFDKSVSAAIQSPQDVRDMKFAFQDAKTIIGTTGDGKEYSFIDSNHSDTGRNDAEYVLSGNGGAPTGELCAGKIKLTNTNPSRLNQLSQISAQFNNFSFSVGTLVCTNVPTFNKTSLGNPSLAYAWFDWVDKNTITLLGYGGNGDTTFTRGTGTNPETGLSDDVFYAEGSAATPAAGNDCRRQLVLVGTTKGHSFQTSPIVTGYSQPASAFDTDHMSDSCQVYFINEQRLKASGTPTPGELAASTINIGHLENADKEPAAAADASNNTCESNNSTGLEWLLCGIIGSVDKMVGWMNNAINDQLDFNVKQNLQDPAGIKKAWASIKNIATAILVIIMLVMVISQAFGGGPFDAYTIRKLLPKMVAAVILMQISWDLCIWIIGLANDAGRGIGNLLAAPFGGFNQLSLDKLVGGLGVGAPGATLLTGLTLGTLAVALNPFGVLLLGFVILMAVFAALATLLFRVVLIIAAVITAPLALAAWILPGTEKYWKQWWSNFSKALLLFPLVVSMIVIGRIFAWIISSGGAGTVGPFDLFAVLVGYFGPYFLLPKAFKWGGSLLATAANGISSASTKLSERPKKLLQDRKEGLADERRRRSAERVSTNVGFNKKRPWRYPVDKFKSGQWDPTLTGRRSERAIAEYKNKGEASYQEDLTAAETGLVRERQAHRSRGGDHDLLLQAVADGRTEYNDPRLGTIQLGKRSQIERMAARKQLSKLGAGMNWRYLENYYEHTRRHGTDEERSEMRKFFDDNVETIKPRLPHIYSSVGQAADGDPGAIGQMHGVGVESVLSNLSRDIETGTTWDDSTRSMRTLRPDEVATKQTQLTTFLRNFQGAVENSKHGGQQIENGALRAVKGFLDRDDTVANDLVGKINNDPDHGRAAPRRGTQTGPLPGDAPRDLPLLPRAEATALDSKLSDETKAALESLRASLADQISPDGTIMKPAEQEAEQEAPPPPPNPPPPSVAQPGDTVRPESNGEDAQQGPPPTPPEAFLG